MIPYINEELFNQNSIHKQVFLTFSNGDILSNQNIESESLELIESLCSEQQLKVGSCEASVIKFTLRNVYTAYRDETVIISMVLNHDTEHPFILGSYKVLFDTVQADKTKRTLTCYDSLYDILNAEVSQWYDSLFPTEDSIVTLLQFRNSFFEHFRITQETETLINDDITVSKTLDASVLSGKDIIVSLCELNGVFGHITRNNTFKYVSLSDILPNEETESDQNVIPIGVLDGRTKNYKSCDCAYYETAKIDKVIIRQEDTDIGAIAGTGDNALIIQGNFLTFDKNAEELRTIAQRIYNKVKDISYRPVEIELRANPCIEVGDGIKIESSDITIYSYVLHRTIHGLQALTDTIVSDGPEYRDTQVNSENTELMQLKGKTAKLTRTIEVLSSEISDLGEQTSTQIQQLSNSVAVKVNSQGNIVSQLDVNTNGMAFSGNKVIFDTENFKLNAQGNATFSGKVESTGTVGEDRHKTVIDHGAISTDIIFLNDSEDDFNALSEDGLIFTGENEQGEDETTIVQSGGIVTTGSVTALEDVRTPGLQLGQFPKVEGIYPTIDEEQNVSMNFVVGGRTYSLSSSESQYSKVVIYTYDNPNAVVLNSDFKRAVLLRFKSLEVPTKGMFHAQIIIDCADDSEIEVRYVVNGAIDTGFCPIETYVWGKHTLNLFYPVDIPAATDNRFEVQIRLNSGEAEINAFNIKAALSAQGLDAHGADWDGIIEIEERFERFSAEANLSRFSALPQLTQQSSTEKGITEMFEPLVATVSIVGFNDSVSYEEENA